MCNFPDSLVSNSSISCNNITSNLAALTVSSNEVTTFNSQTGSNFSPKCKYLVRHVTNRKEWQIFESAEDLEKCRNEYRQATWKETRKFYIKAIDKKSSPTIDLKEIVRQGAKEHHDEDVLDIIQLNDIDPETLHTKLTKAVKDNDITRIWDLLNKGASPDACNQYGLTPLQIATQKNNKMVVTLLLEESAEMETPDIDGKTVLHIAAEKGFIEIVDLLLRKGASSHAIDENGRTPLHLAAMESNWSVVKLLLELETEKIDLSQEYWEKMPIIVADKFGKTPFHLAVEGKGRINTMFTVNEFLNDIKKRTKFGKFQSLAHTLVLDTKDKFFCKTALHFAVANEDLKIVENLLAFGAKPNQLDSEGNTPLHIASEKRNEEMMKLLVRNGADPKIPNKKGYLPILQTPIEILKKEPKAKVTESKELLSLEEKMKNLEELIHLVVTSNFEGVKKLLSDKKYYSLLNLKNAQGHLVLNKAVNRGDLNIVTTLLGRGANPNTCDDNGNTALHIAARECDVEIIKVLMPCALDSLFQTNKEGKSPIIEAMQSNNCLLQSKTLRELTKYCSNIL